MILTRPHHFNWRDPIRIKKKLNLTRPCHLDWCGPIRTKKISLDHNFKNRVLLFLFFPLKNRLF
jgi:hypothetical protein